MSNSKYEITDIAHKTYPFLHRIRALQDIGDWAKAGDLGGFVESESNLAVDPDDAAWITGANRIIGGITVNISPNKST